MAGSRGHGAHGFGFGNVETAAERQDLDRVCGLAHADAAGGRLRRPVSSSSTGPVMET